MTEGLWKALLRGMASEVRWATSIGRDDQEAIFHALARITELEALARSLSDRVTAQSDLLTARAGRQTADEAERKIAELEAEVARLTAANSEPTCDLEPQGG